MAATDFPFYRGTPLAMSGRQWAVVLLAVALGFAALHLPAGAGAWRIVPAILFPMIPLLALRAVAGPMVWSALFKPMSLQDIAFAVGIALLNIAVTFGIGALVVTWIGANANPAVTALSHDSVAQAALFFLSTVPQLLGEEVLTLLPFLALLTWLHSRLALSRRWAVLWAWLGSALPFALVHLPTYQWNLLQCLLIIGTARLVLSLAYLRSRNLLVSALAHITNDWLLFFGALMLNLLIDPPA